jgi:hypothetical protein
MRYGPSRQGTAPVVGRKFGPGFHAESAIRGVFGERDVQIVTLTRRAKKPTAVAVGGCGRAGTIGRSGVSATFRVPGIASCWSSRSGAWRAQYVALTGCGKIPCPNRRRFDSLLLSRCTGGMLCVIRIATGKLFSYASPESLVPQDHPLRAIHLLVNAALDRLSPAFEAIYAEGGRPSIAPSDCCGQFCCRRCSRSARSGG